MARRWLAERRTVEAAVSRPLRRPTEEAEAIFVLVLDKSVMYPCYGSLIVLRVRLSDDPFLGSFAGSLARVFDGLFCCRSERPVGRILGPTVKEIRAELGSCLIVLL